MIVHSVAQINCVIVAAAVIVMNVQRCKIIDPHHDHKIVLPGSLEIFDF